MSIDAQQIAALAAELSEADIGELIRAKVPAKIKGRDVTSVYVSWSDYGFPVGKCTSVSIHVGKQCAVCVPTFARAVEIVGEQLLDPRSEANDLRSQAAKLIAEAAKIEGGVA